MSTQVILVADDEPQIRDLLALYFGKEGFAVEEAGDGAEAIVKVQQVKPSLLLLDIMMPVMDGLEVCRQVRKISSIPIILLTARAEDEDRIMGLDIGADDYITKPFNPREVVARVKAVLRRSPDANFSQRETLCFDNLEINMAEYKAVAFGKEIVLTAKEMEVLWYLASHPGRVFSREQLLESVWGYTYYGDTRTVDTHIKRIRQKLEAKESTPWDIKTVWGVGYKFEVKP